MCSTFPSFRRQPPDAPQHRFDVGQTIDCQTFVTLPISVLGFPRHRPKSRSFEFRTPSRGSGLRHFSAGSPQRPAELRSSSYGPMIHLRLLSTPPRGDAVTFSYRPESACLEGTSTLLIEYTFRRTRVRPGRTFSGARPAQPPARPITHPSPYGCVRDAPYAAAPVVRAGFKRVA